MAQEKYGWLLPDGTAHECAKYNHSNISLAVLVDPNFQEQQQDVRDAHQECTDLDDAGEHPEWHSYEMTLGRIDWQARKLLYAKGALRYGTFTSPSDGQRKMEFEGIVEGIHALRVDAARLATKNDCAPTFTYREL